MRRKSLEEMHSAYLCEIGEEVAQVVVVCIFVVLAGCSDIEKLEELGDGSFRLGKA